MCLRPDASIPDASIPDALVPDVLIADISTAGRALWLAGAPSSGGCASCSATPSPASRSSC